MPIQKDLVFSFMDFIDFPFRFCTTGLPTDVTIEVGEMSFHIHKVHFIWLCFTFEVIVYVYVRASLKFLCFLYFYLSSSFQLSSKIFLPILTSAAVSIAF